MTSLSSTFEKFSRLLRSSLALLRMPFGVMGDVSLSSWRGVSFLSIRSTCMAMLKSWTLAVVEDLAADFGVGCSFFSTVREDILLTDLLLKVGEFDR